MKRKLLSVCILFVGLAATSCQYQRNNTIDQADFRANDTYVYGVHPDSAAAQTKNKYNTTPELDQRTNAIRAKMFGGAK